MARRNDSTVRIGSITIFALVIVLCIAVMGMLSVSTGRAALAASEKQAMYTSEIYQNEEEAWKLISKIDEALYDYRLNGWWSKSMVLQNVSEVWEDMDEVTWEDDEIDAVFTSENGKTLTVKMTVTNNLNLQIDEWKVSTDRETDNGDVLWMGF